MGPHKSLKIMTGIKAASRTNCMIALCKSTRRGRCAVALSNLGHPCRPALFGGVGTGCFWLLRAVDRPAKDFTVPAFDLRFRVGLGLADA